MHIHGNVNIGGNPESYAISVVYDGLVNVKSLFCQLKPPTFSTIIVQAPFSLKGFDAYVANACLL